MVPLASSALARLLNWDVGPLVSAITNVEKLGFNLPLNECADGEPLRRVGCLMRR